MGYGTLRYRKIYGSLNVDVEAAARLTYPQGISTFFPLLIVHRVFQRFVAEPSILSTAWDVEE